MATRFRSQTCDDAATFFSRRSRDDPGAEGRADAEIARLRAELALVTALMHDNIDLAIARGPSLDALEAQSEQLVLASQRMLAGAQQLSKPARPPLHGLRRLGRWLVAPFAWSAHMNWTTWRLIYHRQFLAVFRSRAIIAGEMSRASSERERDAARQRLFERQASLGFRLVNPGGVKHWETSPRTRRLWIKEHGVLSMMMLIEYRPQQRSAANAEAEAEAERLLSDGAAAPA